MKQVSEGLKIQNIRVYNETSTGVVSTGIHSTKHETQARGGTNTHGAMRNNFIQASG